MTSLYKKFRSVILRQKFILGDDSILAGLSGGVDSMVLADLLLRLQKDIPFALSAAHVNYGLRGKESDAQEKLVRDWAAQHRLPCFVARPDLKGTKENFQQAARDFRYHFFAETALQIGAGRVAVAHHLEDQVETILAQFLRGASLKGLSGMRGERGLQNSKFKIQSESKIPAWPAGRQNPKLIRPLLSFSKVDLKKYAKEQLILYIEDSSNTSPKYWRNRLRHELLPVIHRLRPRVFEKIKKLGEEFYELVSFLEKLAGDWVEEFGKKGDGAVWLPRPRLLTLPQTLRLEILRRAYVVLRGDAKHLKKDHLVRCDQLACSSKGEGYYPLPGGLKFVRNRDDLMVRSP